MKRHFTSPMQFLADKISFINTLYNKYFEINPFDKRFDLEDSTFTLLSRGYTKPRDQFLSGFNPLITTVTDFFDTFTPYPNRDSFLKDLIQPLRGLGNIIRGIFNFVISPVIFIINVLIDLYKFIFANKSQSLVNNLRTDFALAAGGLADGFSSAIRGIVQILATPLTYFIRLPIRFIWMKIAKIDIKGTILGRQDYVEDDTILHEAIPIRSPLAAVSSELKTKYIITQINLVSGIINLFIKNAEGKKVDKLDYANLLPTLKDLLASHGFTVSLQIIEDSDFCYFSIINHGFNSPNTPNYIANLLTESSTFILSKECVEYLNNNSTNEPSTHKSGTKDKLQWSSFFSTNLDNAGSGSEDESAYDIEDDVIDLDEDKKGCSICQQTLI